MESKAKKITKIAMTVAEDVLDDTQSMTHEQIVDFLYSQVKHVEITVILPEPNKSIEDRHRNGVQKYPQPDKEGRNEEFMKQYEEEQDKIQKQKEKEQEDLNKIEEQWKQLACTVASLPPQNNGKSFYDDLIVKVLKNRLIKIKIERKNKSFNNQNKSNNPYDECNKNNPFLYEGINSIDDYRTFLIEKFENNLIDFNECIVKPRDFDMPLDIFITNAIIKETAQEVTVYVKFGIHDVNASNSEAKIKLEFENFSFHPPQYKLNEKSNNNSSN